LKYCVIIMDGAAGWPLPARGGKTCLELARKPNLDRLAREGECGLVRTVPAGMEPSSAIACMSVLGYDPGVYYRGRSAIEARSLGIPVGKGEVTFRCNLVTVLGGVMKSYSAGNISSTESCKLITSIQGKLGNQRLRFYPGVDYRHILVIKDGGQQLQASCTPPHDIPDKPIGNYLPKGPGSELLRDLMSASEGVLSKHPVNALRVQQGRLPATMIWLFWGSGEIPELPPFEKRYGKRAAMTSAVDLLNGLAKMAGMTLLDIDGVTADLGNNYAGQAEGALDALDGRPIFVQPRRAVPLLQMPEPHDLVVVHVEAPDEMGHEGNIDAKIAAIERIDKDIIARFAARQDVRIAVMPDHPTPIELKTHCDDPVPFVLWGPGFRSNGAVAFTEAEAKKTGLVIEQGHTIMARFTGGSR